MKRTETTCPRCNQVNARYQGAFGWLANPRWPDTCTLCGTNLATGRQQVVGAVAGMMTRISTYTLHALVGAAVPMVVVALVWPSIFEQPVVIRTAPLAVGAACGLYLAERSRRKGRLL